MNVQIKNIGPISTLSMPVPEGGGVVVLKGRNGSGKSTALDAISAAVSGKGKPPIKDLSESGEIVAGGIKMTVGRSIRRRGELEVATLEGRLSVADLVDPGISDPSRADATRIKALVGLSGIALSVQDLHGFPQELLDGLDLADPVSAMTELKRRLDIGGREYEKMAKAEGDKAAALLEQAGDTDDSAPSIESAMVAISIAQRKIDGLLAQEKAAIAASQKAEEAERQIALMKIGDILQLEAELGDKSCEVDALRETAQRLKAEYNAVVDRFKTESAALEVLSGKVDSARQAEALRSNLEKVIDESRMDRPTDDDVLRASIELNIAKEALAFAESARQSSALRRTGIEKAEEAARLSQEAISLRRKAKQTEEVLNEIVSDIRDCPLKVSDGRLVISTKRGPTFFGELSHGERWRVALDIAVSAVGAGGMIVIPQEAWEGLDGDNRNAVAGKAKNGNVIVITAECGDGDLVVEEMNKETA